VAGGIFVGVKFSAASRQLIREYVRQLNLPTDIKPVPNSELHITVIYSKTPLPIDYPLDKSPATATAYDVRCIGNAVAIILESPWLRWRYRLAKLCGYMSDYSGLIPHSSIIYDPPPNLPVAWWPKPNFMVELAGEYQETPKD
jgi:hypothetical protein